MTIRLRLTLWYSAVLAVTAVGLCIAVYFFVSYVLYSGEKSDMRALAQKVYDGIEVRSSWITPGLVVKLPELDEFSYSGYFLQVVDRQGNIQEKNTRSALPVPRELLKMKVLSEPVFTTGKVGDHRLLVLNVPIRLMQEQFVGLLQVATTVSDIEDTLNNLRTVLTLLAFAAIVAASTLGWFLARKALQPIELIIAQTDKIEQGSDLNNRIAYSGPQDEVGMLTVKINGMLSRIQSAYEELQEAVRAQRRFVSDASHELRTPLTTIRGNVELLEKMMVRRLAEAEGADGPSPGGQQEMTAEALRDIGEEAERMSRLVNDLLMLARADAGQKMKKEPVELKTIAVEVARKAQHLPRSVEWTVSDLSALDGVLVMGDKDYLRQLLFIFIENAFKYTSEGEVEMSALVSEEKDRAGIRIRDTGIGMDKDDVPRIFDRFYRADLSRGETSGTGLGLSIARWIIDEHDGTIEVLTKLGEGSSFIIWLPTVRAFPTQEV
jgi:two-component system, OmpR family, sensor kinase